MARSNNTTNAHDKAGIVSTLLRQLANADTLSAKKQIRRKLRAAGAYVSKMNADQRERAMNVKARKVKVKSASNAKDVAEVLSAKGDNAGA
jgi:hypothetical protein